MNTYQANIPTAHYECWEHRDGQKYLVRLGPANAVTGVCGPMVRIDVAHATFANYDYDAQPQHTAWVQQNRVQFRCISAAAVAQTA
jgi:hypothetical protein